MTLRLISNTRASEPGTITSLTASLGTLTYRVSPGLALVGLKVILFTVRSALIAPRTFFECEGSRLGGTAMVYNVFSKLICILVMAEGGVFDPTTENETPWEDHGIDHDDDDDDEQEVNTTQPFQPGASSTPYHEGEAHEMANMGEEGDGIPLLPKYGDFVPPEEKETLINRFKAFIKAKRPTVDFSKIVISLGKQKGNEGKAVALGPKGGETVIFKQDNTFTKAFSTQYGGALGESAEEIIAEDRANLTDALRRVREAQILEDHLNKQAEREQQEEQKRKQLETQLVQINDRIEKMENEGGTMIERQNEIDRLRRESDKLKRDIKDAKSKAKDYAKTAKERDKASKEVSRLQRQYETQRQKLATTEEGLNRTKPLDELEVEEETLKRKIEEDQQILNDENASSEERNNAYERYAANVDELARLESQIQEREQELSLRERVKNIFKKYGWTLQAVALAVGIVLSALALAATNGLKAGTKAIGNGLEAIGKKLGSLLPGLIGSIVSYIFKAAGSVLSFLGGARLAAHPCRGGLLHGKAAQEEA